MWRTRAFRYWALTRTILRVERLRPADREAFSGTIPAGIPQFPADLKSNGQRALQVHANTTRSTTEVSSFAAKEPKLLHVAPLSSTVQSATPVKRRGKSMSRRTGQSGHIERSGTPRRALQVLDGACRNRYERPLRQNQRGRRISQGMGREVRNWFRISLSCTECTENEEKNKSREGGVST